MERIKLQNNEWQYDPSKQLGDEGGFGAVFEGYSTEHGEIAVKKLKIRADQAEYRELSIAKDLQKRNLKYVVPVLDSGQDADSQFYFVVMARATKSLQEEFMIHKDISDTEAATILIDIANGLSEVSDIVHRDLKPANVLYHEDRWKVADFGIARFVEDSTSANTVKGFLSRPYAAPEQWKSEHSTNATDVYALGCIGYFLLTGSPPFHGPSDASLRQQHLSDSPPNLDGHSPLLCSLLSLMLRKNPNTRPVITRVIKILGDICNGQDNTSPNHGVTALADAGAMLATQEAQEEAKHLAEQDRIAKRKKLKDAAFHILKEITNNLFDKINTVVPNANIQESLSRPSGSERIESISGKPVLISLGKAAHLGIEFIDDESSTFHKDAFYKYEWDVVAGAIIFVTQFNPKYVYSASLWYSTLPSDDNYRWREVSYIVKPSIQGHKRQMLIKMIGRQFEPFAMTEIKQDAVGKIGHSNIYDIVFGPEAVDDEDFGGFCDRWCKLLAEAANGELVFPRYLPPKSDN